MNANKPIPWGGNEASRIPPESAYRKNKYLRVTREFHLTVPDFKPLSKSGAGAWG
jgi:hypothetical protein